MFHFHVWKLTKDRVFLKYSIHDDDAFIVVLKADGTVVNN